MSNASEVSVAPRSTRTARHTLVRSAIAAAGAMGVLLVLAATSSAQSAPSAKRWELRVASGAFVPVGSQRDALKDAQVTVAQLSWLVRPSLAVTGSFGWARSRDLMSTDTPKLDVFSSDLGIEARPAEWFASRKVSFSPFVGVGGGARSYNYRKLDVDATNNLAAYASAGGEIGAGRVGVRLEVRDYATGFKPLVQAGTSATRNDVVIMAALRFDRHHASRD